MVAANSVNESTTGIVGFTGTTWTATPTTQYNVQIGGSTSSTLTQVAPSGTSGVPLISQGASADPAFGTAVVAGGGTGRTSFATVNGVVIGNGTSALGLTAAGSSGQIFQSASPSAPGWTTATYPSTTTVSQILYSSASNTVSGLATVNRGVLTTGATGVPAITALATDGQLIIGSTAGAPAAASLTGGTGIVITPGSNSISIATNTSTVINTLTGDSGGAISPSAGNINTLGSGSITIAGSGSTLTT